MTLDQHFMPIPVGFDGFSTAAFCCTVTLQREQKNKIQTHTAKQCAHAFRQEFDAKTQNSSGERNDDSG